MSFKRFAGAALVTLLTATSAFSQTGDIKGWTPRAPGSAGGGGGGIKAPPPPGGGGAEGPKSIVRGPGDPAPRPPGGIAGGPKPPGPANAPPSLGGGKQPGAGAGGGTPEGYNFLLATDPYAIQRVIQNAGYKAEMSTDDEGNPKIIGSSSNSTYWIMFLDCNLSIGCAGLQFFVGYSPEYAPSLEAINDFNNQYRYIRASVGSNGNPLMFMDIIVRDGGISEEAFLQYLGLWNQFVPAFEDLIGF